MVTTSTTILRMTRHFDVNAEKLFDAWLNSDMIRKWLFTMETTNKVTKNDPRVGGTWEIIDHRGGKDYRAIGEYLEIVPPTKLVFTFRMPQFNDLEDRISVEIRPHEKGCEMEFSQGIVVPHDEGWTSEDINKALKEYQDGSEQGWDLMFRGLKQLVETGKINYPS